MNKRDKKILEWVRAHRSDCMGYIQDAFDERNGRAGQAFLLLLMIGFEAGREFERETPGTGTPEDY